MITCASRRTVGNSLASNGRECIIYTTPYHSGGKPAHTFTTLFDLFHRQQRRNRSHGHRSNSSRTSEITLDLLRNFYNGGQGHGNLHRLLTTLHSARLPNLHKLFTECEQLIVANQEQRFRSIVLDVCCKRLFFPVRTDTNSTAKPRHGASSKCFSTTKE